MIDIPGVGQVEADNAASEATLQAILKQLGGQKGPGQKSQNEAAAAANKLSKAQGAAASNSSKLGAFFGKAAGAVAKFGAGVAFAAKVAVDMSNAISANLAGFSNLDNNVTSAASKVPLLGKTFASAAEATEKLVNATQNATNSGATFGGSVFEMSNAASRAGMTINEYSNFVRKNGDAFRLLGGDVETGRKRFDALSKDMRKSGFMRELNNMGFTTVQVNESMARYTTLLGRTGKLQGMSTKQLTKASADYMKEIDLLAKATGRERSEIEDAQAQLLTDGQYQAKISGMTVEAADSFRNTITGLTAISPELGNIAKDIITTGSATTKESQLFASTMPKSAKMMMEFAKITEAGGTISLKQRNELNNLMSQEGKQMQGRFRDVARYDAEMAQHYMNLVNAGNIQTDALLKGTDAQNENAKATDGQMSAMEAMRRRINEISQTFTRLLASTGIMDTMMGAFETIAAFSEKILFPILEGLFAVIMPVVDIISAVLNPAITILGWGFTALGEVVNIVTAPLRLMAKAAGYVSNVMEPLANIVGINLIGAFNSTKDALEDTLRPPIDAVSRVFGDTKDIANSLYDALAAVGGFLLGGFKTALNWAMDGLNWFGDTFEPIITPIADLFSKLSQKVHDLRQGFIDFWNSFQSVGDVMDEFKYQLGQFSVGFSELMLDLKKWIDWVTIGTSDEEEVEQAIRQEKIDLMKAEQQLLRETLDKKQAINRKINKAEQDKIDEIRLQERKDRDKELQSKLDAEFEKLARAAEGVAGKTDDAAFNTGKLNDKLEEELDVKQDLSNAESTLKSFAKNNESFLTKPEGGRTFNPIGQVSSARGVGDGPLVEAGYEKNALDVAAEDALRQKKMDNPDYVPGKSEKEASTSTALNTEASLQMQSETLKVQYRILDAIEEMNMTRA